MTAQTKKEAFVALLSKHNIHHLTTDQLYSALYTEFGINDDDLLLSSKEKELVTENVETGIWEDTDENRGILVSYYVYAAECATDWDARD